MRLFMRLFIVTLSLLLLLPSFAVSSQGESFVEGLHVDVYESHHHSTNILIEATKRTTPQAVQLELHIYFRYGYIDGTRNFETTVDLSANPDQLNISKNLSLGKLDTTIQVEQHRTICASGTCGAEFVEIVPLEIHIQVAAPQPAVLEDGVYKRHTNFRTATGTLKFPDGTWDINGFGGELIPSGYNFSNQSPGDTIGIFRTSPATFYMRNTNTTGYADSQITFGLPTDYPVVGDWNGDGIDTVGVYRASTGQFFLTDAWEGTPSVDYMPILGIPNDLPVIGDWDGDGRDGIGVYRPSNGVFYLKNALTSGTTDYTMLVGTPNDIGVAGDWDGDGKDSPGVYRPSNTAFYLTNLVCNCSALGEIVVGFGIAGDTPVIGDWNADGKSGIGVYRRSNGLTYIKDALTTGFADSSFVFGSANDYPLAGHWARAGVSAAAQTAPSFIPKKR